jgi:hypothetical protein
VIPRPAEPGLIFRVCETSEEPEAFLERVRANAGDHITADQPTLRRRMRSTLTLSSGAKLRTPDLA